MTTGKKIIRYITWLGVVILQLIMTQVLTFLASLIFPDIEDFQRFYAELFVVIVGFTFGAGIFLAGWLGLKLHWLTIEPKYLERLATTLIGAYVPLILALVIYHYLEAGNPFFLISILAGILGFYVPSWLEKK